jgi:hypothetical protein
MNDWEEGIYKKQEKTDCNICLNDFEEGEKI